MSSKTGASGHRTAGAQIALRGRMKSACVATVGLVMLAACAAMPSDDVDNSDPDFDGKSDSTSTATLVGPVTWSAMPQTVQFAGAGGTAVEYLYETFSLSGSASVSFETSAAGDASLDTVLYLYQPTGDTWGAYIAKNDDGGAAKFSKLAKDLGAGDYRVVIKRKTKTGTPSTALVASCTGDGCAPPPDGCTDLSPRTVTPTIFIGPGSWESSIEAQIDAATTSLDVQMYLFDVTDIAQHVIDAQSRGVAVRVLLDATQASNNKTVKAKLDAAGVPEHLDPSTFSFAHAKYLIVDKRTAVILSGNFNGGAVKTTGGGERNYGIVDTDAKDVADLQSIYEADWIAGPEPDLSCTRLVVSPINSKDRLLAHVASATATLDIEVLYLDDADILSAVIARAQAGVAVRVMLSDPAKNPQNTATAQTLAAQDIPVKFLIANYLHAKMLQADGVAQVGSENMSETSLLKNREVGELIFEPELSGQIHDQYEADWAAAVAP
jgi:hypothetical protein